MGGRVSTERQRAAALVLRQSGGLPVVPDQGSPGSPEFELTATRMAREFSEAMAEIA